VLTRIGRLTAIPASFNLIPYSAHAGAKFLLIIERGHHHMPPFPSLRVIAVMADDETLDAVVPGFNSRHNPRLTRSSGDIICKSVRGQTLKARTGSQPLARRTLSESRQSSAAPGDYRLCFSATSNKNSGIRKCSRHTGRQTAARPSDVAPEDQ
jgi:hypothetical protein